LVNNERKHIKRIVDKIVKMKPDLLLIEKSANRYATELLLSANISVV
jgi:ABC-type Fe3+-hydroxamate transport system substrate-binding protein